MKIFSVESAFVRILKWNKYLHFFYIAGQNTYIRFCVDIYVR